jgi:hypothetical protein
MEPDTEVIEVLPGGGIRLTIYSDDLAEQVARLKRIAPEHNPTVVGIRLLEWLQLTAFSQGFDLVSLRKNAWGQIIGMVRLPRSRTQMN